MSIEIKTERLILRNYCNNDLDNVHTLKSDNLVWRFSNKVAAKNIEESREYLSSILKNYRNNKYDFGALFIKGTEEYIGEAGIISMNKVNRRAVLGYNLLPKYWGKGYATEIIKALVKYMFEEEKVERIEALVMDSNKASRRVLEKSGFTAEGLLRNFAYINYKYCNVYYYGIISSDYFRD